MDVWSDPGSERLRRKRGLPLDSLSGHRQKYEREREREREREIRERYEREY